MSTNSDVGTKAKLSKCPDNVPSRQVDCRAAKHYMLNHYLNQSNRVEALNSTDFSKVEEKNRDGGFVLIDKSDACDHSIADAEACSAEKVEDGFVLVEDMEVAQLRALKEYMAKATCPNMLDGVKKDARN